ncbi:Pex19-domain-containing protein [Coprinellus micaceus]|uniref:Pex19-domain-containing protein n=1 Tax=Coprinellus micaceus TaxID=71717 RepID=A0A4Y7T9E3_COPMI|nr:Pex19-domain-containing protein [Coprinellus micaceus]
MVDKVRGSPKKLLKLLRFPQQLRTLLAPFPTPSLAVARHHHVVQANPHPLKAIVDADDDLDELDDVLEEFTSKPTPSAPPPTAAVTTSAFARPRTNTRVDSLPPSVPGRGPPLDATSEIDEDLLSSEAPPPSGGAADDGDEEELDEETKAQARAFKAAWEAMLVEGMNGKDGEDPLISLGEVLGDKNPGASSAAGAGFQDKIKQAMEKMKEAETKTKAAESSGSGAANPESMEELLKTLGDLGLGDLGLDGPGGGDDSELAGFLESMMGQLMSKEILYEPLKELADGSPKYLADPPKPLSTEDRERYEKQLSCVKRIVTVFEEPSYSDSNPESNKVVVDLMSEMQSYGSPPAEIMGDLPPGFDGTGFPGVNPNDENCTIV